MSVEDTLQFLHTRSGARPTARPFAGQLAGDVVVAPHYRYPAGRARVPWFDTYGGGGRKTGLGVVDAIKQRRSGYSGTVIRTKRGTVVQTRGSAVAGKSRADAIRLVSVKRGPPRTEWTPTIPTKRGPQGIRWAPTAPRALDVRVGQIGDITGLDRPGPCGYDAYPCGTMPDDSLMCCPL